MDFQQILWVLSVAAECVALAAFFLQGWAQRYFWWSLWVAAGLVRSCVLVAAGGPRSPEYGYAYLTSEPLKQALLIAAVWECYSLVGERYNASRRFRYQILMAMLGTAAMFAGAVTARGVGEFQPLLRILVQSREALYWLLSGACALMILASRWAAAPGRQNAFRHLILLTVYLAGHAIASAGQHTGQGSIRAWNLAMLTVSVLCFGLWPWWLTRAGETAPPPPSPESQAAARQAGRDYLAKLRSLR